MRKLDVNNIYKQGRTISVDYVAEGVDKYIDNNIRPFWQYDSNIESVPESIAIVPFLANMLPIIFVFDIEVHVSEIDMDFFGAIERYREAYRSMIPQIEFKGKIIADRIVKNANTGDRKALLFSGGIDAVNSLCSNVGTIDDCITVWGSDVRVNNEEGWQKVANNVAEIAGIFKKRWMVVKSNFRDYIKEGPLTEAVAACGDNWWHGFQHGVALLGQTAPLVYLNGYSQVFIASSFTKNYQPICASDPRTDSCFAVCGARTVHDGFEFDRCQKVENIANCMAALTITNLKIHVCWESTGGDNCGRCEKCIRTYLNCLCSNVKPETLGICCTLNDRELKRFIKRKIEFNEGVEARFLVLKNAIKRNFGSSVPNELGWLAEYDPLRNDRSLYWRLRRTYRFFKRLIKHEK